MYTELIRLAWDKMNDEQRGKLGIALAQLVDKLMPKPVVLVDGREDEWPSPEQIQRSQAAGFPVVHLHFGIPKTLSRQKRKGDDLQGSETS